MRAFKTNEPLINVVVIEFFFQIIWNQIVAEMLKIYTRGSLLDNAPSWVRYPKENELFTGIPGVPRNPWTPISPR